VPPFSKSSAHGRDYVPLLRAGPAHLWAAFGVKAVLSFVDRGRRVDYASLDWHTCLGCYQFSPACFLIVETSHAKRCVSLGRGRRDSRWHRSKRLAVRYVVWRMKAGREAIRFLRRVRLTKPPTYPQPLPLASRLVRYNSRVNVVYSRCRWTYIVRYMCSQLTGLHRYCAMYCLDGLEGVMQTLRTAIVGIASLLLSSPSWAVPITYTTINPDLTNPSFELGTTGWTFSGSPGAGVYSPTSNQYTPGSDGLTGSLVVPDGSHAAYSPTGLSGSGSILQNTTTDYVYNPIVGYSFTFWVGVPNTEPNGTTPVVAGPVSLYGYWLANGNTASGQMPTFTITLPAVGHWEQETVFINPSDIFNASANGQTIGIEFFEGNATNNQAVNFDISTTPLPAALPLFATGIGAMGLFGWRRKRKNTAVQAA